MCLLGCLSTHFVGYIHWERNLLPSVHVVSRQTVLLSGCDKLNPHKLFMRVPVAP